MYHVLTASAETDLARLIQRVPPDWADEITAAFASTYKRLTPTSTSLLQTALAYLPFALVTDPLLRTRVERLAHSRVDHQPLKWALPSLSRAALPPPFQIEDATEEWGALFAPTRGAFWPDHPLFKRLGQVERAILIVGQPGCGRTATALALDKFGRMDGKQLTLYQIDWQSPDDVLAGYARAYLDLLRHFPTRLQRLSEYDARLLARLLCVGLGQEVALAELRAVQLTLNSAEAWHDLAQARLNWLAVHVEDVPGNMQPLRGWPRAIVHLAQQVGFEKAGKVYLIIDNSILDPDQLRTDWLPQIKRWQADGLITLLFAPQLAEAEPRAPIEYGLPYYQLTWTHNDLKAMVHHRYKQLGNSRRTIDDRFDSAATIDRLLAASRYNPRRFMQLWRQLEELRPGETAIFKAALVKTVCDTA